MKQEELNFRLYCRRNHIEEVDEEIVNDFMFEDSIYGEEMFNTLMNVEL